MNAELPITDYEIESIIALGRISKMLDEIPKTAQDQEMATITALANLIRSLDEIQNSGCNRESDPDFETQVLAIKAEAQEEWDRRTAEAKENLQNGDIEALVKMFQHFGKPTGTIKPE